MLVRFGLALLVVKHIVDVEIFSALIEALEEIHDVSQTNIDFQLVHVFEYFDSKNAALYSQSYLWAIHFQFLFVVFNEFSRRFGFVGSLEEKVVLDFRDL